MVDGIAAFARVFPNCVSRPTFEFSGRYATDDFSPPTQLFIDLLVN